MNRSPSQIVAALTCPACSGGDGPLCESCSARRVTCAPGVAYGAEAPRMALADGRVQACPGLAPSTELGRRPLAGLPLCGWRILPVDPHR